MKGLFSAHIPAIALVLLAGTCARADVLNPDNVQWTYKFSPGAPAVYADSNPSAGVTFTNEPTKTAVGSSDVVVTNLRVFSAAPGSTPDMMQKNGAYTLSLSLALTDGSNTNNTTLVFTGKLTGTLSKENANITNVFGPNNSIQTVTLGKFNFTVTLAAYTPPGPPDQTNAGSIAAHVTISDIGGTSDNLPEPSTMLLSAFGLTCLGAASWRKRRARNRLQTA
jgi:hypothetical protein